MCVLPGVGVPVSGRREGEEDGARTEGPPSPRSYLPCSQVSQTMLSWRNPQSGSMLKTPKQSTRPPTAPGARPLAQGYSRAREERPRRLETKEGALWRHSGTCHSRRYHACDIQVRRAALCAAPVRRGTHAPAGGCTLTLTCSKAPCTLALRPAPCTMHPTPCTMHPATGLVQANGVFVGDATWRVESGLSPCDDATRRRSNASVRLVPTTLPSVQP